MQSVLSSLSFEFLFLECESKLHKNKSYLWDFKWFQPTLVYYKVINDINNIEYIINNQTLIFIRAKHLHIVVWRIYLSFWPPHPQVMAMAGCMYLAQFNANLLRLIMTLLLHFMGPDEILDWARGTLSWASSKAAQREPESQSYSAAGWAGAGKINILAPRKYTSGKRGFIFWYAWESKETSRDDDWLIWNALVIWKSDQSFNLIKTQNC